MQADLPPIYSSVAVSSIAPGAFLGPLRTTNDTEPPTCIVGQRKFTIGNMEHVIQVQDFDCIPETDKELVVFELLAFKLIYDQMRSIDPKIAENYPKIDIEILRAMYINLPLLLREDFSYEDFARVLSDLDNIKPIDEIYLRQPGDRNKPKLLQLLEVEKKAGADGKRKSYPSLLYELQYSNLEDARIVFFYVHSTNAIFGPIPPERFEDTNLFGYELRPSEEPEVGSDDNFFSVYAMRKPGDRIMFELAGAIAEKNEKVPIPVLDSNVQMIIVHYDGSVEMNRVQVVSAQVPDRIKFDRTAKNSLERYRYTSNGKLPVGR